jgi:hypothetical protein
MSYQTDPSSAPSAQVIADWLEHTLAEAPAMSAAAVAHLRDSANALAQQIATWETAQAKAVK